MNKQALSLAVCIAGAYPLSSGAIGLGDIRSSSHLNQPLNAKIELLSTSAQEAGQIKVRLASKDVFNRVGIDRPGYLDSLSFTSSMQNGRPVILVSSNQPIQEPFLNFLLEVSWPSGQLLKEYTVLLDPPVLLQTGNTLDNNTAAIRAEPKATGFVKRPASPPARTQPSQVRVQNGVNLNQNANATAARQAPTRASSGSRKYRVKSGDTLYKIAARNKPRNVSADQMMVALFRANPNAFRSDNINRLKAGSSLKIPAGNQTGAVTQTAAKSLIRKHYAEWKQYRKKLASNTVPQRKAERSSSGSSKNQKAASTTKDNTRKPSTTARNQSTQAKTNNKAHLEVMGSDKQSAKSNSKASAAGNARIKQLDKQLSLAKETLVSKQRENTELKSRVSEMESIIQKKNRLIALKNDQLAKLQRSLANASKQQPAQKQTQQARTPANNAAPTSPNKDISSHLANKANQDQGRISRTQPQQAAQNNTAPNAKQNATGGNQAQQDSKLTPAALAAKRREAAMAEAKDKESTPPETTGFKPEKGNALIDLLSSPIVAAAGAGSIFLLLLGWWLLSRRKNKSNNDDDGGVDEIASSLDDFDNDFDAMDDVAGSTSAEADDDFFKDFDIEDADSKPNQVAAKSDTDTTNAASQASSALDSEVEDDILQEADVYIVYGLHEQAETELKKAIKDNPNKLEYRLKLLENYLASNNKEAFDIQAKEIDAIDADNKPAIWQKVVEMGRKISPDNPMYQNADDSDDGSSSSTIKTAATAAVGATAVAAAAMASGSDDEITADASEDEFNLDDVLLDDNNNSDDTKPIGDVTADLGDDDFSDLGLDDDEFSLDDLEKELDDQATTLTADESAGDNVIDFESMLLDEDNKTPAKEDNLDVTNLNLEVDSDSGIDRILPKDTPYTSSDDEFDVDDDDILSFLDLPEEDIDLHEAHISTKLDLARAYLDMGDIEGARSTLEEVIVEGSDDQKREAEDLLHQTG